MKVKAKENRRYHETAQWTLWIEVKNLKNNRISQFRVKCSNDRYNRKNIEGKVGKSSRTSIYRAQCKLSSEDGIFLTRFNPYKVLRRVLHFTNEAKDSYKRENSKRWLRSCILGSTHGGLWKGQEWASSWKVDFMVLTTTNERPEFFNFSAQSSETWV